MSASVAELPRWKCHKEVWAVKIGEIRRETRGLGVLRTDFVIVPEDPGVAPIPIDSAYLTKHQPAPGGYYVVYNDGYKSFSPAEAFEEGYTRV